MKPYHNFIILGITIGISYFIKKRLNGNKKDREVKKIRFFLFFRIFMGYTILCYLCVFLFGSSVKGMYLKMTMDKYKAIIVELDSYSYKYRSGKLPVTIQQITVKFKPQKSSNFITKKLDLISRTPPDIKMPYEIRYNERTSIAVSNTSTDLNVLLIAFGLIPLYFVLYGVCYAFNLKLCNGFPKLGILFDEY